MMTEKEVRSINRERQEARQRLLANLGTARHDLHPAFLARRWRTLQIRRFGAGIEKFGDKSGRFVRENATWLSLLGIGALLFTGRKPILKWMKNRKSVKNADEEQDRL